MAMRTRVEHGAHAGEPDRAHVRIETVEDYERATRRIAALDSAPRSDGEERERHALAGLSWQDSTGRTGP